MDSVADIRNEVRVFGLDEIERTCSDANREHGIVIVGDVSVITGWIGEDDGESKRKLVSVVCKHRHSRQVSAEQFILKFVTIMSLGEHVVFTFQSMST